MKALDYLPFGPLNEGTAHLCLDMQRLFGGDTPWHTPWMERVLPVVETLASAKAAQTIFTRFMPPASPVEPTGAWRRYYERWKDVTRERLDPHLLELMPSLSRLVPPATVVDKPCYSAFVQSPLFSILRDRGIDALVISGAETDVCVLATVLSAVDLGYRVVVAVDALCSSADRTHDALMTLYHERFTEQVEVATTEVILSCWL